MSHPRTQKRLQNPLRMLNPSWTHQTRWCNFLSHFRKEEWLINSTEITNFSHTILTQHNSSFMNSEIITSDKLTNKPILSKKDKIPSSLLLKLNSSIILIKFKQISQSIRTKIGSWRKIDSWKTYRNLRQSFKSCQSSQTKQQRQKRRRLIQRFPRKKKTICRPQPSQRHPLIFLT